MRSEARAALDAALRRDRLWRALAVVGLVAVLLGVGWCALTTPLDTLPYRSSRLVEFHGERVPQQMAAGVLTRVDVGADGHVRGITLRLHTGGEAGFVLDAAAAPADELRHYLERHQPLIVTCESRGGYRTPRAVQIVPDER